MVCVATSVRFREGTWWGIQIFEDAMQDVEDSYSWNEMWWCWCYRKGMPRQLVSQISTPQGAPHLLRGRALSDFTRFDKLSSGIVYLYSILVGLFDDKISLFVCQNCFRCNVIISCIVGSEHRLHRNTTMFITWNNRILVESVLSHDW
jgi:hypothetical protein